MEVYFVEAMASSMLSARFLCRQVLMEFLCTFFFFFGAYILVLNFVHFQLSSAAFAILLGPALSIWVFVILWIFFPLSGAHLNPILTLSFSLFYDFPWTSCAAYVVAQVAASTLAAFLAPLFFFDAGLLQENLISKEHSAVDLYLLLEKLRVVPPDNYSNVAVFGIEFLVSFLLLLVVYAINGDPEFVSKSKSPMLRLLGISKDTTVNDKTIDEEASLDVTKPDDDHEKSLTQPLLKGLDKKFAESQEKLLVMGKLGLLSCAVCVLIWMGGYISGGIFNPVRILGPCKCIAIARDS